MIPRRTIVRAKLGGRALALSVVLLTSFGLEAEARGAKPVVSESQVPVRLAAIQQSLEQHETAEHRWHWGWIGTLGTLAVAQAAAALWIIDSPPRRDGLIYGSIVSSLGALGPLVVGNPGTGGAREELAGMPESTPGQRRAKLARAEELLAETALAAELSHNPWLGFALPTTGAAAMGIYIWQKHDAPVQALTFFLTSTSVGALRYLSRPTGNLETHDRLEREVARWQVAPFVTRGGGGLTLGGSF